MFVQLHLWTDSKVAISWVGSTQDIKDIYVASRVAEIQTIVSSLGIRMMHVPTETNSADLLSHSCNTNKLKSSIWQHGPEWITTQHYPEQAHMHVATNELVVEINPVNPVPPVLDLERISSYTRAINIMSKVLSFTKSSADPLPKLVMQEQCLHCNSINSHSTNPKIKLNIDIKNTIKDLDLHLIDNVIRAKDRLINSEFSLEALLCQRHLRQTHQVIHVPIHMCHNQSCSSRSRQQPVCNIFHPLLMLSSSSRRHPVAHHLRQPQDIYLGRKVPSQPARR